MLMKNSKIMILYTVIDDFSMTRVKSLLSEIINMILNLKTLFNILFTL